jgi:hypothetical protein
LILQYYLGGECPLILTGWKDIARHLGCGVRTAQRWEHEGLPIRRPLPGKRSHVVTASEQLDRWVRGAFWRTENLGMMPDIQRSRELRAEIKRARETLHQKMDELKKELAALRAKRQRYEQDDGRKK